MQHSTARSNAAKITAHSGKYQTDPLADEMRKAADAVERLKPELASTPLSIVRTSVDEIREHFLSCYLHQLVSEMDGIEVEILSGHQQPDHASRKTDIQIRSCLPDSETLVAKRLGHTLYAVFGSTEFLASTDQSIDGDDVRNCDRIGISPDRPWYPEQKRWLDNYFSNRSTVPFNTMTGILNATRSGTGIALLPCFMAENYPELVR